MSALRITAFVGARPNLPKAWTLQRALSGLPGRIDCRTVHTGQHFTGALGTEIARELGLRVDEWYLTPTGDGDARRLGDLMVCVETELGAAPPDCVIAMGDVNSTLATAVVAARSGIPVIHLEAGLRSHDGCPEEVNRRAVSALASCHLCPSEGAIANLMREGTPPERLNFVGNAMIECLLAQRPRIREAFPHGLGVAPREYALMTAHKPLTLSRPHALAGMCAELAASVPTVLFPCHPHTRDVLQPHDLLEALPPNVVMLPPRGYLEFAALVEHARVVVTDSDGVQEECCATSVPCCIMTEHTARPECVAAGGSVLVGLSRPRLRAELRLAGDVRARTLPPRWDERVSARIRDAVLTFCDSLGGPRLRRSSHPERRPRTGNQPWAHAPTGGC